MRTSRDSNSCTKAHHKFSQQLTWVKGQVADQAGHLLGVSHAACREG